jgi:hypothetical protein
MPKVIPTLELKPTMLSSQPVLGQAGFKTFIDMLQRLYQQLAKVINGGLTFGDGTHPDNISVFYSTQTPATAGVDFTLIHNLGRIPAGYLAIEKSASCDLYTGSVAATATQITLRSSVNGVTLRIMVF